MAGRGPTVRRDIGFGLGRSALTVLRTSSTRIPHTRRHTRLATS